MARARHDDARGVDQHLLAARAADLERVVVRRGEERHAVAAQLPHEGRKVGRVERLRGDRITHTPFLVNERRRSEGNAAWFLVHERRRSQGHAASTAGRARA